MSSLRKIFLKSSLICMFLVAAIGFYGEASAAQLDLTWSDNSGNEDGFKIERRVGASGTFTQIAAVGTNVKSYADSNLIQGNIYCYRVRAFNTSGDSAYSNDSCALAIDRIDSDGDGIYDYIETNTHGTDPFLADSDGDGLNDGDEVNTHGTDPLLFDSDGDGSSDRVEIAQGTDPLIYNWADYRVRLMIKSKDNDAIGVMFRYQGSDNYYRFSWDSHRAYRRLVKRENGVFTVLDEDAVPFVPDQTYQVEIVAQGSTLEVMIDGALVFSVTDTSFAQGTIGLYSWANRGSWFDNVVVEDSYTGAVIFADDFNDGDFAGWSIMTDEGTIYGPSDWSAATGVMVQSSNIHSNPADAASPDKLGTYALYNKGGAWADYRVGLSMKSKDDDAIGVMFRYQGSDNYYRFSWDNHRAYRRLVKKENGVFTVLDEDSVVYVPGQSYNVEIVALGTTLQVLIDGALIFSVSDTSFAKGTVGLYSWANRGSWFDNVVVEDISSGTVTLLENFNDGDFAGWSIITDDGTIYGPSVWSAAMGVLVQSSNIHSNPTDSASLAKLGTYALY